MDSFEDITRLLQPYAIGISFAAIYAAEHLIPQRRELIDHAHDGKNLLAGLLNLAIAATGGYFLQSLLGYTHAANFGLVHWITANHWVAIAIGFVLLDILMYWWHRINHRYSFLWQFHSYHHRDEKLNSTTAVRFHAAEILLSLVLRFLLFPLLGMEPGAVLLHGLILFPVILFHHSNIRIAEKTDLLLRILLVTPHMHRTHHSKYRQETDSNYGSIFPYWDVLFGTYTHRPRKKVDFGL